MAKCHIEYHIYNAEEAWEDVSEENKILVKEFIFKSPRILPLL